MPQIEIEIPAADGVTEAYFVTPDGPGPFPAVLLFMDAFGLRPRIMEMAADRRERVRRTGAESLLSSGSWPAGDAGGVDRRREARRCIRAADADDPGADTGADQRGRCRLPGFPGRAGRGRGLTGRDRRLLHGRPE